MPCLETPVTLAPTDTVIDALHLMGKRPHGAVVVVDAAGAVAGVVRAADCEGQDRFASLGLRHAPPAAGAGRRKFDGGLTRTAAGRGCRRRPAAPRL